MNIMNIISTRSSNLLALINISLTFISFLVQTEWLWALVVLQCLIIFYFYIKNHPNFCNSIFWPIFLSALLILPWPLSFIVPIFIFFVMVSRFKLTGCEFESLRLGNFNNSTLLIMFPVIVLSSSALIVWSILAKPELSDLQKNLPYNSPLIIIFLGLLFSVFNAIWEEIIFKGILWNGVKKLSNSFMIVNFFQGLLFGIMHLHGFPSGITGAYLSGIYGLLIGFIREKSNGLLAPIVTHFFADITIFIIIATY